MSKTFLGEAKKVDSFLSTFNLRYERMKEKWDDEALEREILHFAEEALTGDVIEWWGETKKDMREVTFEAFKAAVRDR